jgi:hypothetical protein
VVVLDSQSISALAYGPSLAVLDRVKAARNLCAQVVFPTVILAEVLTGKPTDAAIWRIVNTLIPIDLTTDIAATAGRLREQAHSVRRKKRDLTVDAIVAATAIAGAPSLLITGDPADMTLLSHGNDVRIVPI